MLEDEIAWLSNFMPSEHQELKETDNCLLAGHLKLIKTLFTCESVSKEEYGRYLPTWLSTSFWRSFFAWPFTIYKLFLQFYAKHCVFYAQKILFVGF